MELSGGSYEPPASHSAWTRRPLTTDGLIIAVHGSQRNTTGHMQIRAGKSLVTILPSPGQDLGAAERRMHAEFPWQEQSATAGLRPTYGAKLRKKVEQEGQAEEVKPKWARA